MKTLELLEMANGYRIEKFTDGYEVTSDDYPLMAFVANAGHIEFYRTKVHKAVGDIADIDMEALLQLKALCEEIVRCLK